MSDENLPDQAVELWNKFRAEQPKLAFGLSVLPVTGQVTAAIEYYDAMKRGDTADGIAAAVQFGLGGLGAKAGKTLMKLGDEAYAVARADLFAGRTATSAEYAARRAASLQLKDSGYIPIAAAEGLSVYLNAKEDREFQEGFESVRGAR
jgi:hypothetical protein